jgi:hypothetical protein
VMTKQDSVGHFINNAIKTEALAKIWSRLEN